MKTATLKLVLAALLTTTAACTAESNDSAAPVADEQELATTPAMATAGLEMYIGWQVRAELAAALSQTEGELDFGDVIIPGVLRVQHQYSVAALRLEVSSWALLTDLTPPDVGSWGINSALGVSFPRWSRSDNDASFQAAEAAARKFFGALSNAKETSETVAANTVETTRASEHGSFSCTKTTRPGNADAFRCTIAGVGQVGGGGLLWDWSTANAKAQENENAKTR